MIVTVTANSDYTLPMENMLTFSHINNISCLPLSVTDDSIMEYTESFRLMIVDDMSETYNISIGEATVYILDNDQIITTKPETTHPLTKVTTDPMTEGSTSPPTAALPG